MAKFRRFVTGLVLVGATVGAGLGAVVLEGSTGGRSHVHHGHRRRRRERGRSAAPRQVVTARYAWPSPLPTHRPTMR